MRALFIAAAMLACATAQGQMFAQRFSATAWSPLRLSPAAWYQAENNALDSSGFGRDGTWSGTEAYTNGVVGRAWYGNGSSRVSTLTAHSGAFTLAMWINAPATQAGTFRRLVGKATVTTPQGWQIQFPSASNGGAALRVDTSEGFAQSQDFGVLFTGQWLHFVMTFNTASGVASLYIDGAFVLSRTYAMGDGIDNAVALTFFSNSAGSNPMVGAIDDAMFWGRILTAAEIKELYDRSVAQQGALWKVR